MKLSVTQYNREIVIEEPDGDAMTLPNLHENMIRPLLLAMEFHPNTVDKLQYIDEEVQEHYTDNMVREEGYIACIPWEQIEKKMGKEGFKKFNKWMEGQTAPLGGVYSSDLDRYLKGLPALY